jgi:FkbM family methyltransferase
MLEWLTHFSHQNLTLIDVGANIGLYTIFWATLSEKNRCIAIEPCSKNLRTLRKNSKQNCLGNRVKIMGCAISGKSGNSYFVDNSRMSGDSRFSLGSEGKKINTKTIDSIVTSNNLSHVILKIDTDGHDFECLKSATDSLISGRVISINIEISIKDKRKLDKFCKAFDLLPDARFNLMATNSKNWRRKKGKYIVNRIYTKPRYQAKIGEKIHIFLNEGFRIFRTKLINIRFRF